MTSMGTGLLEWTYVFEFGIIPEVYTITAGNLLLASDYIVLCSLF